MFRLSVHRGCHAFTVGRRSGRPLMTHWGVSNVMTAGGRDNSSSNGNDSVYGAVDHHCIAIARVHLVHLTNAEQRQLAANLWRKPNVLIRRSACRQLHHRHYIYY